MLPPGLIEAIEEDHRALDALLRGDAEPKKKMFSHRPEVSLANPLGPPIGGSDMIETTLEGLASQLREGQAQRFERISEYATEDLAYVLEIERCPGIKVGDSEESKPFSLRATTVWRRETDGWKIAHRHADPITTPRPLVSIFES
ncbi:MAG TPA: nuclear transport factor 2 family protein [Actinomycetota bacterium]|nr:nuclear transport factor 2 family protein [Actinomycetota bacterium]